MFRDPTDLDPRTPPVPVGTPDGAHDDGTRSTEPAAAAAERPGHSPQPEHATAPLPGPVPPASPGRSSPAGHGLDATARRAPLLRRWRQQYGLGCTGPRGRSAPAETIRRTGRGGSRRRAGGRRRRRRHRLLGRRAQRRRHQLDDGLRGERPEGPPARAGLRRGGRRQGAAERGHDRGEVGRRRRQTAAARRRAARAPDSSTTGKATSSPTTTWWHPRPTAARSP